MGIWGENWQAVRLDVKREGAQGGGKSNMLLSNLGSWWCPVPG